MPPISVATPSRGPTYSAARKLSKSSSIATHAGISQSFYYGGLIAKTGRPDTKIIPGHGAIVDKNAVAAHKAMMIAVRDKVAALVKQNKTQEEVVASKPTSEWDSKVTGATPMTADRFVGQLYQELKSGRAVSGGR